MAYCHLNSVSFSLHEHEMVFHLFGLLNNFQCFYSFQCIRFVLLLSNLFVSISIYCCNHGHVTLDCAGPVVKNPLSNVGNMGMIPD